MIQLHCNVKNKMKWPLFWVCFHYFIWFSWNKFVTPDRILTVYHHRLHRGLYSSPCKTSSRFIRSAVLFFRLLFLLKVRTGTRRHKKSVLLYRGCVWPCGCVMIHVHALKNWRLEETKKKGLLSASPVGLFILICPEPTQERSGQTYASAGLGRGYPERCTQIAE